MWSDWGLGRAVWWAALLLQPHAVVVPGDMLDEGKLCDDAQHAQLLHRFKTVFSAHKSDHWHVMLPFTTRSIPLILSPGNHDLPPLPPSAPVTERTRTARRRSMEAFGSGSCTCVMGHVFRSIDTSGILFSEEEQEGGAEGGWSRACEGFACGQAGDTSPGHHVVVTHAPMFRSSDSACGGERGMGGGVTYLGRHEAMVAGQDVLAERDSMLLMQAAQAEAQAMGREVSVVLSGHTHAPCFILSAATSATTTTTSSNSNSSNNSSRSVLHATLSASGWRMRPDASCALLLLHHPATLGSSVAVLSLPHEHLCIAVVAAAWVAAAAAAGRVGRHVWRSMKRRKAS